MSRSLAVVFGSGKLAENMASILASRGRRVAMVGDKTTAAIATNNIKSQLRDRVECDMPFQFVDDLRLQDSTVEEQLARIQFTPTLRQVDGQVEIVFDTHEDEALEALSEARRLFPLTPIASVGPALRLLDPLHVGVHLYQPIETTKIAQVCSSRDTDPSAVERVRQALTESGIREISATEGLLADRVISDWQRDEQTRPSRPDTLRALLSQKGLATQLPDTLQMVMH